MIRRSHSIVIHNTLHVENRMRNIEWIELFDLVFLSLSVFGNVFQQPFIVVFKNLSRHII